RVSFDIYTFAGSNSGCSGFTYQFDYHVTARIPYIAADITRGRMVRYIYVNASAPSYAVCSGTSTLAIASNMLEGQMAGLGMKSVEMDTEARAMQANLHRDIPVSLFIVRGQAEITNKMLADTETSYTPHQKLAFRVRQNTLLSNPARPTKPVSRRRRC
ncbi:MAG: hypothetical protein COS35_00770, partial [Zetaproteobacteria bacterium CG02_land_8_20_14_3_00_50_9]